MSACGFPLSTLLALWLSLHPLGKAVPLLCGPAEVSRGSVLALWESSGTIYNGFARVVLAYRLTTARCFFFLTSAYCSAFEAEGHGGSPFHGLLKPLTLALRASEGPSRRTSPRLAS